MLTVLVRWTLSALIVWFLWPDVTRLRWAIVVLFILNEMSTFVFTRLLRNLELRKSKGAAIHRAIQKTPVGGSVIVHNDDGSVWAILRVETKEYEHDRAK